MEQGLVNISGKSGNRSFSFVGQKGSEAAPSGYSTEASEETLAGVLVYPVRHQWKETST